MIRALHEKSERYFRFQIVNAPIRQQAHDEHMALIALCREGRADDAGAALERHIEQAAAQILAIVDRLLEQRGRAGLERRAGGRQVRLTPAAVAFQASRLKRAR